MSSITEKARAKAQTEHPDAGAPGPFDLMAPPEHVVECERDAYVAGAEFGYAERVAEEPSEESLEAALVAFFAAENIAVIPDIARERAEEYAREEAEQGGERVREALRAAIRAAGGVGAAESLPSDEQVERAAIAAFLSTGPAMANGYREHWDQADEYQRNRWRTRARAALFAAMEPLAIEAQVHEDADRAHAAHVAAMIHAGSER